MRSPDTKLGLACETTFIPTFDLTPESPKVEAQPALVTLTFEVPGLIAVKVIVKLKVITFAYAGNVEGFLQTRLVWFLKI